MGLLAPLGLGLLALLAPIIAMYLLKRRREEVVVSSTFLWERVVQDMEANAPWQRLRRNLLLLLQVLFILLLVLAAARPFLRTAGAATRSLIVILDSSASMGATDGQGGGTRLEAARREILRLAESLPPDGRLTLIRAGGGAEVLVAGSRDRVAIEQAMAAISPTASDSDLSAALNLAGAVAARQPGSEIVLLSDGAVTSPTRVPVDGTVRYVPLGESGNNQAISALTLRPQGQGYSLFIQVTNYAQEPVTRRLVINADGRPFVAFDLTLQPGERVERVVDDLPGTTGQIHARLDGEDLLALDDEAWAVPPVGGTRSVRLVTPGNIFLRAGLSLLPEVALTTVAPGSPVTDTQSTPTLTVLDRTITDSVALAPEASGALLFVAPPAPVASLGISVTGTISQPVPVPASADDPLLRYVDLSGVAIAQAQHVPLPSWARPVIVDGNSGAPLLWVGETGGRQVAMVAFDLHASDLVLRVAFPLLLANLVDTLTLGPTGQLSGGQFTAGQPVSLPLLPEATGIVVQTPEGRTIRLQPDEGRAIFTADRPGLYEVRWEGTEEAARFAVNLFNPQESNLAPIETLALGGTGGATGGGTMAAPLETEGRQELWRWLALVALAVLLVEWLVSQRDAIARLRMRIRARSA